MIHSKKTAIIVSLIGYTLLISINALSMYETTVLEKSIEGLTCTKYLPDNLFGTTNEEVTECDINKENLNPRELYSHLVKNETADIDCITEGSTQKCQVELAGIICTKSFYFYDEVTQVNNEHTPKIAEEPLPSLISHRTINCDIDEEAIDAEELYKTLMVGTTYTKYCYDGGAPVECPRLLQ